MAKVKKIRFPLEMKNGITVRTLEELKENFSLEKNSKVKKTRKTITQRTEMSFT